MELPATLLDAVMAHCHAEHPYEACGVLIGPRDGAGPSDWRAMRNVAEFPRYRYAMDETEQLDVWRAADEAGQAVLAIYHSHTDDDDLGELSPEDLRHALDPDILHLVVRVALVGTTTAGDARYGARCRLWKVVDGQGVEQAYTVVEPS